MKKSTILHLRGLCILLFTVLFLSILPLDTYAVVEEGDYGPQISLNGNCELIISFDVVDGEGWLEVYLYDTDASTIQEAINNSPNCLRMRANDCFVMSNVPKEKRWNKEIECTSWQYRDKSITIGQGYELRLNRWGERISVTVTGSDNTRYWDMTYDAGQDMADPLFFCLLPHGITLDNVEYTLGETDSVWDTRRLSGEWFLGICLAGIVLLFVLNYVFSRIEKDYFYPVKFNLITGGLWVVSLVTALCLSIPGMREIYCTLLGGIFGVDGTSLRLNGVLLWVAVAVCAVICLSYWIYVMKVCDKNFVIATLLMLLFGIMHAIALYFIIGVAIRMIIGGILLAVAFLGLTGVVRNTRSDDIKIETPLDTPPEYLSRGGEGYHVVHVGKNYLYIYPCKGGESEQFMVTKRSERCYVDKDGNEYMDWR